MPEEAEGPVLRLAAVPVGLMSELEMEARDTSGDASSSSESPASGKSEE